MDSLLTRNSNRVVDKRLTISPKNINQRMLEQPQNNRNLFEIKAISVEEDPVSKKGIEDFIGELENQFDNLIDQQDEQTKKANGLTDDQED